jgi:hypothetical protein
VLFVASGREGQCGMLATMSFPRRQSRRSASPWEGGTAEPENGAAFAQVQSVEAMITSLNERGRQVVILTAGNVNFLLDK